MAFRLLGALALMAACAGAQQIQVFSEFQRVDPFGGVLAVDRAVRPREILSPALARNAFATLQVVVTVPAGQDYTLFAAQNPEHAVKVTAYNPVFVKKAGAWIPDKLEPLAMSDAGQVERVPPQTPGATAAIVWLDLWVDRAAPVRRTRLEIQLHVGEHWVIYPMELRITTTTVPAQQGALEPLAAVEAPASATAAHVLRGLVCGAGGHGEEGPLTVRRLIRRNARQDVALAHEMDVAGILEAVGGGERAKWCQAPSSPAELGAEWYLRARDYIYRTAANASP